MSNDKTIDVNVADMAFITSTDTLIKGYITARLKELRKADDVQATKIACQIACIVAAPRMNAFQYLIGSAKHLDGLAKIHNDADVIMHSTMGDCV